MSGKFWGQEDWWRRHKSAYHIGGAFEMELQPNLEREETVIRYIDKVTGDEVRTPMPAYHSMAEHTRKAERMVWPVAIDTGVWWQPVEEHSWAIRGAIARSMPAAPSTVVIWKMIPGAEAITGGTTTSSINRTADTVVSFRVCGSQSKLRAPSESLWTQSVLLYTLEDMDNIP